MNKNIINRVYLVLDKSGSMKKFGSQVSQVFDSQVKHWKNRASELNQEIRLSTYVFSTDIDCLFFDRDIQKCESIKNLYEIGGDTNLIGAASQAIKDGLKIPIFYNQDVSNLLILISDGENNIDNHKFDSLKKTINQLEDSWTVSCLVPNINAAFECQKLGFPKNNIQVWNTNSEDGYREMGNTILAATDNYMLSRSKGIRGTKSLFTVSSKNINRDEIKKANLEELSPKNYSVIPVYKDTPIKEYVESWLGDYVVGSAYFQLNKPEVVQSYKNIIITNKVNGKAYMGEKARELLSLPAFDVKVSPDTGGQYNIFVQSSSVNRKLIKGTQLIVLK